MKAAIFKGVKQMACEEHAEPTIIDGGDAIIRVVRACVCGSDLWFYRDGSKEPNTQAGHEAIGVVEQIGDAFAGLARHAQHVARLASDQSRDLLRVLVRLGTGQVDLVEHGDDGQIVVDGHVQVGQRLRLDALRRVDEQHRALACGQRARHLIREIHVAGGVDHAERVLGALEGPRHAHGLRFDGDATLLLDVHAVEEAVTHLALRNDAAQLQDAVGHRGLAVVDVRDDAEIPD